MHSHLSIVRLTLASGDVMLARYNDVTMNKELSIEELEKAINELFPDGIQLTRIYPDGKVHPNIPGLYYASDKFWEEFDKHIAEQIRNININELLLRHGGLCKKMYGK